MNALPSDARIFIVHHNPNSGRYRYPADPNDVVASVKAMLRESEATWVAGNCHRMIREGDLLLFKFGGSRLMQAPGRLPNPVPYKHPSGAIIWVRLEPDVLRKVRQFAMPRRG